MNGMTWSLRCVIGKTMLNRRCACCGFRCRWSWPSWLHGHLHYRLPIASGCAVFYEQLEANGTGNSSRAGSLAAQALVLQMQADSLSVANEFGSLLQVCRWGRSRCCSCATRQVLARFGPRGI